MSRPVAFTLRLYRALARAFPQEFQNAYGEEMMQAAEDSIEPVWRRHGIAGLLRLIIDIALRLPAEYAAEFKQDVRYGLRSLAGSPGFTAVAMISLTLGIGVATSAFSEMNGFVMRDVPAVSHPEELVMVGAATSYPHYQRYREHSELFTSSAAYAAPVAFAVRQGNSTERVWGHIVTPSYLAALGVRPVLGQDFGAGDEAGGAAPRIIVSYAYWQQHLGGDAAVVGRSLTVNHHLCTIIGVGPRDFRGASPMTFGADLWMTLHGAERLAPELAGGVLARHDVTRLYVIGRLRPGVTEARAEMVLDGVARQLNQDWGEREPSGKGRTVVIRPGGKLVPLRKQDLPFFTTFFTVLGGMILLIASANVTNMMLARAMDRRQEIAVRLALGAGRGRLVRQLLTESMLVAASAGLLGFALASILMHLASRLKYPSPMPITFYLEPDARVLIFTLAMTLFTGLALGLLPALRATRADLSVALKPSVAPRHRHFGLRNALMLAQVAASLALLLITGFLVMGHRAIAGGDLGFEPRDLALVSLDPVRSGYTPPRAAEYFRRLLDRIKSRPSTLRASIADSVPMSAVGKPGVAFTVDGPDGVKRLHGGRRARVGEDFFSTIGIPLLAGRTFRKQDETDESTAAVVSANLARDCWPGREALGQRIELGDDDAARFDMVGQSAAGGRTGLVGQTRVVQVVGVVEGVRDGVNKSAPGMIYLPLRPADYARSGAHGLTVVVRSAPGADALEAVRRDAAALDERLTPFEMRTMVEQVDQMMFAVRSALWTYGVIAAFGLLLAVVGLAGVTAYTVSRRRREIGIRMALGARRGAVLRMVMQEGAALTGVGTALGLGLAWAGIRALSVFLSSVARASAVSTSDPRLLVGAPLLLAALALAACYLPARRSLGIDPAVTLREE